MSPVEPKSYLKLGFVVLILVFLVIISSLIIPGRMSSPLISPGFFQGFNLTSTYFFVFKSEGLSNIVQSSLRDKSGEYALYIEDLSDGENYSLRSSDTFPAASLYKLYLMAAVLKEIDNGKLTMETRINASKSSLVEEFGGVDFGYEDIDDSDVIEYTIDEALTRVGRISDNFAAIMLMDKIGRKEVQDIIDSTGATSTSLTSPISTSASDIGLFFKLLYKGEIVNKDVSEKLIEFLSLNQLNNRIPAGLPEGIKVIHKTGELAGVRHDAGIVWLNSTPGVTGTDSPGVGERAYVIVLMSKDLKYEDEGVETLANISKDVYEYFRKKYEK